MGESPMPRNPANRGIPIQGRPVDKSEGARHHARHRFSLIETAGIVFRLRTKTIRGLNAGAPPQTIMFEVSYVTFFPLILLTLALKFLPSCFIYQLKPAATFVQHQQSAFVMQARFC